VAPGDPLPRPLVVQKHLEGAHTVAVGHVTRIAPDPQLELGQL